MTKDRRNKILKNIKNIVEEIYRKELANGGTTGHQPVPKSILKKSSELQRDLKVKKKGRETEILEEHIRFMPAPFQLYLVNYVIMSSGLIVTIHNFVYCFGEQKSSTKFYIRGCVPINMGIQ